MSKAEFVVGSLGGAILILIFIWIAVALYLAYTKMDVMLEHLKNSSAVKALAFYRQLGVWGHLKLIGEIAALITSPDKCNKSGRLSAQDIENFPAPLKKKLAGSSHYRRIHLPARSISRSPSLAISYVGRDLRCRTDLNLLPRPASQSPQP
ncbi:hypothetical protein [Pseudomonas sp. IT-P176]|uniref:hypothetical protein n=1 Tax=Pseudomonas sp. IT-P176 TaxID=3026444 RepID=UPI0039DFC02A